MQTKPGSPFASVIGLGAFKGTYAVASSRKKFDLSVSLFLVAVMSSFGILATLRNEAWTIPFLCVVAGGLVVGVLLLINLWRNWPIAAALYESGLAYRNRGGVVQARWDDVETVHQAVTPGYSKGVIVGLFLLVGPLALLFWRWLKRTAAYTVRTKNGQKIVLTGTLGENVATLGDEVQRGAAAALLPRYRQSLQSGQRLTFGPLAMDREKIYAGKNELRWDEIKAIKIEKGRTANTTALPSEAFRITIIKAEKGGLIWASARVPLIPNFYVFNDLVSGFAKVE